jgi:HTH-type transcriptional regulator / antitoxin MqsA
VTENERIDPETGAMLRRDVRSQSVVYRGFRTTVMLPGWYHDDSDDGVHTRDDTAVLDEALVVLKARALSPDPR